MRLSFYIAKRYLFARKSRNAINIISGISVAGVSVGTMALIIILSVFNGLEGMVSTIFNTFDPEIKITAAEGKVFNPVREKLARLDSLDGIAAYSMTLEENALVKYEDKKHIATVKGVDDNYPSVTGLDSSMVDGEFRLRSPGGRPEAVIGAGVANFLGLNINFIAPLQIWVPRRTGSVNLDPEDAFIKKFIAPSGVFQIEQDFDSKYVLIPLGFARDLLEYDTEVSSIEIKTDGSADADELKSSVKKIFGPDFIVKDRLEQQAIFYKVMRTERLAIFIILTLILLIASFNIIGSLTMLIIEKERDITAEILRNYLPADSSKNLPALFSKTEEGSFSNEREILYKVLFDMKRDMTELKKLVLDIMENKESPVTGDHAQIFRNLYDADSGNYVSKEPVSKHIHIESVEKENIQDTEEFVEESLSLEDKEIELIKKALDKNKGKRKYAAQELGISERTLYRKIKEYDIKG